MDTTAAVEKISLLKLAFAGLSNDELEEMSTLTQFHVYPAGHVLCQEGEYEDIFYIVAAGNVVVTQKLSEGEGERTLRVGGKGDLVGEMALIQNTPRSATVRATTECTVLEMGKQDFETILSKSPHLAIDIIRITLDRLRANDKTAIADLQRTNKILRQLDRNKLEFIQVAAHELRTPLTVMKGYINMLRSFPELKENPSLGSMLDGILNGTNRMHEVVNLMLDITRIDDETLKIASVPVLMKRVIVGLVNDFSKAAAERHLEIDTSQAEEPHTIYGDPALVEKALYHLLVNAIKYTPDGGRVSIKVRPVNMEGNIPGIEIAIQDTGIGLDAEHHDLVFEKFYQVGSVAIHSSGKTSFKGGGPGLGLAIVRGVARAHNGKTWVESAGHDETNFPGSTFYLQLPVNEPQAHPAGD
jgi:signal transduction histidine kinase